MNQFQNNQNFESADNAPESASGSPNLGTIASRLTFDDLQMTPGQPYYFRFHLPAFTATGYVRIDTSESGHALDLRLYNAEKMPLSLAEDGDGCRQISLAGYPPGHYYFRVQDGSEADVAIYRLTVDTYPVAKFSSTFVGFDDSMFGDGSDEESSSGCVPCPGITIEYNGKKEDEAGEKKAVTGKKTVKDEDGNDIEKDISGWMIEAGTDHLITVTVGDSSDPCWGNNSKISITAEGLSLSYSGTKGDFGTSKQFTINAGNVSRYWDDIKIVAEWHKDCNKDHKEPGQRDEMEFTAYSLNFSVMEKRPKGEWTGVGDVEGRTVDGKTRSCYHLWQEHTNAIRPTVLPKCLADITTNSDYKTESNSNALGTEDFKPVEDKPDTWPPEVSEQDTWPLELPKPEWKKITAGAGHYENVTATITAGGTDLEGTQNKGDILIHQCPKIKIVYDGKKYPEEGEGKIKIIKVKKTVKDENGSETEKEVDCKMIEAETEHEFTVTPGTPASCSCWKDSGILVKFDEAKITLSYGGKERKSGEKIRKDDIKPDQKFTFVASEPSKDWDEIEITAEWTDGCGDGHYTPGEPEKMYFTAYRIDIEVKEKPESEKSHLDRKWREVENKGTHKAEGDDKGHPWYGFGKDNINGIRAKVEPECLAKVIDDDGKGKASSFGDLKKPESLKTEDFKLQWNNWNTWSPDVLDLVSPWPPKIPTKPVWKNITAEPGHYEGVIASITVGGVRLFGTTRKADILILFVELAIDTPNSDCVDEECSDDAHGRGPADPFSADPKERRKYIQEQFLKYHPYAMGKMVPVYSDNQTTVSMTIAIPKEIPDQSDDYALVFKFIDNVDLYNTPNAIHIYAGGKLLRHGWGDGKSYYHYFYRLKDFAFFLDRSGKKKVATVLIRGMKPISDPLGDVAKTKGGTIDKELENLFYRINPTGITKEITVELHKTATDQGPVLYAKQLSTDKVKYFVARKNSFYDRFLHYETIRNAVMAAAIYTRKDLPHLGLRLLNRDDIMSFGFRNNNNDNNDVNALLTAPSSSGLQAGVYHDYHSGKNVVTFGGTDMSSIPKAYRDNLNNLLQYLGGCAEQYDHAYRIGRAMRELKTCDRSETKYITSRNPDCWTFTGHSLGGGLATQALMAAQIVTVDQNGEVAILASHKFDGKIFNPAWLNPERTGKRYYRQDWFSNTPEGKVIYFPIEVILTMNSCLERYYVENEFLHNLQGGSRLGYKDVPQELGTPIKLDPIKSTSLTAHKMGPVITSLLWKMKLGSKE